MEPIKKSGIPKIPMKEVEHLGKTIKSLKKCKNGVKIYFRKHAFVPHAGGWGGAIERATRSLYKETAIQDLQNLLEAKAEIENELEKLEQFLHFDDPSTLTEDIGPAVEELSREKDIKNLLEKIKKYSERYQKLTEKEHPLDNMRRKVVSEFKREKWYQDYYNKILDGRTQLEDVFITAEDLEKRKKEQEKIIREKRRQAKLFLPGVIDELKQLTNRFGEYSDLVDIRLSQFKLLETRGQFYRAQKALSEANADFRQDVKEGWLRATDELEDLAKQSRFSGRMAGHRQHPSLVKDKGKEKVQEIPTVGGESLEEQEVPVDVGVSEASKEPEAKPPLTIDIYTMPKLPSFKGPEFFLNDEKYQLKNKMTQRTSQLTELNNSLEKFRPLEKKYKALEKKIEELRSTLKRDEQTEESEETPIPPPPPAPGGGPPPPPPGAPPPPPVQGKIRDIANKPVPINIEIDLPKVEQEPEAEKSEKRVLLDSFKEVRESYQNTKDEVVDVVFGHEYDQFDRSHLQSLQGLEPFIKKFQESVEKELKQWKSELKAYEKPQAQQEIKGEEGPSTKLHPVNKREIEDLKRYVKTFTEFPNKLERLRKQHKNAMRDYKKSMKEESSVQDKLDDELILQGENIQKLEQALKKAQEYREQKQNDFDKKKDEINKLKNYQQKSVNYLKGKFPELFEGRKEVDPENLNEKIQQRIDYLTNKNPEPLRPQPKESAKEAKPFQKVKLRSVQPKKKETDSVSAPPLRSRLRKVETKEQQLKEKIKQELFNIHVSLGKAWILRKKRPGDAGWIPTMERFQKSKSPRSFFSQAIYSWVDQIYTPLEKKDKVIGAVLPNTVEEYLGQEGITDDQLIDTYAEHIAKVLSVSADEVRKIYKSE